MLKSIKGLTTEEAEKRLHIFGKNLIAEAKTSLIRKFLKKIISPIPLMFLAAAFLSYFQGKILDFYFILSLMAINFSVSYWQERKADKAIEELNKMLEVKVKALRDGEWQEINSELLVPGDVVEIFMGDVIPADLEVVSENNLSVNEASLTGESLPVSKKPGDTVYSGAYAATGDLVGRVKATGSKTYFGKTILSAEQREKRSILEKDILSIAKFLSFLSFTAVLILTATFYFISHLPFLETLTLDLSLIIAGIPIALPAVLTLIISLGVMRLASEKAVVRRLASLEDLANVDLLFTDKTGTLTKNEITIAKSIPYSGDEKEALFFAYMATSANSHDLINRTIIKKNEELGLNLRVFDILEHVPADSSRKRSSAKVRYSGKEIFVSVGAPQVIKQLCSAKKVSKDYEMHIDQAAREGYRVLAVAVNPKKPEEKDMEMVGLLLLSDELREDAQETIEFLRENGVKVKMVSGDHRAIAQRIGREVGLQEDDIYSEVLPADKYELVRDSKQNHIVAVTGDGINDLPAVKTADVGFAVNNAVGALKSSSDIVLLSQGISVIKDAIIESRKIFARTYSYSVYRISESFRIILTIFILALIYHNYPLSPIQLIILAMLNDLPIVSLAFNRVKEAHKPAKLDAKRRMLASLLYGSVGIINSLLFLFVLLNWFHYGWDIIATAFFLKLTVSGHMLIFVAHTEERWFRYLPSREVIAASLATQAIGTILAVFGIFMDRIPWQLALFVWVWALFWMQISDYTKPLKQWIEKRFIDRADKASSPARLD